MQQAISQDGKSFLSVFEVEEGPTYPLRNPSPKVCIEEEGSHI